MRGDTPALPVLAQRPHVCRNPLVVGDQRTGIAESSQVLGWIETARPGQTSEAGAHSVPGSSVCLACVLHHVEVVLRRQALDGAHVGHLTVEVDGEHEPCP